ncbi:MAG: IS1380 family transposase, partial [Proteobacteria bacterium]|nr:IS1380 family transposase [Pseudomonadota bacterium]
DARYVRHALKDLLMQRIAQISCGYEDANDCDGLRNDPVFKILAGRYPEIGDALSSQPTMSRFENSILRTTLYRLATVFVDASVASYAAPPPVIVPDFDDTEDRVHGNQQLNLFNGYYGNHCFMPLHVYEGLSGKLIATILKPGKRSDGKQILSIVKRLVDCLHAEQPETLIIFRGDSHFAYPVVMNFIEATENVMYVTGLTGNARLK